MKLLDEVRHVARLRRLALETERCYVRWIEQYIRFHKTPEGFRHPNTMGAAEVERFLTFLAVQRRVSASTQNQAFAAVHFLYRDVLHLDLGDVDALRAHRNRRLPVVLTREEVGLLLAGLDALPTHEPSARWIDSRSRRRRPDGKLRSRDRKSRTPNPSAAPNGPHRPSSDLSPLHCSARTRRRHGILRAAPGFPRRRGASWRAVP